MSKKVFALVSTLVTAGAAAAIGVVVFIGKGPVEAITASISIAEGAAIAICSKFVNE